LVQHLSGDFIRRFRDEIVNRTGPLVAAAACSHGYRAVGALAIPYHQHVGNLLQLRLPDLISNLFLAVVEIGPETGCPQPVANRCSIVEMAVGNGQKNGLNRRQPERERARVMLDQDGNEPFKAAEYCTMNDDRPMLGVVRPDVFQVEPLR
jgi:hypothetical protein